MLSIESSSLRSASGSIISTPSLKIQSNKLPTYAVTMQRSLGFCCGCAYGTAVKSEGRTSPHKGCLSCLFNEFPAAAVCNCDQRNSECVATGIRKSSNVNKLYLAGSPLPNASIHRWKAG